jgi:hypothetical protein
MPEQQLSFWGPAATHVPGVQVVGAVVGHWLAQVVVVLPLSQAPAEPPAELVPLLPPAAPTAVAPPLAVAPPVPDLPPLAVSPPEPVAPPLLVDPPEPNMAPEPITPPAADVPPSLVAPPLPGRPPEPVLPPEVADAVDAGEPHPETADNKSTARAQQAERSITESSNSKACSLLAKKQLQAVLLSFFRLRLRQSSNLVNSVREMG